MPELLLEILSEEIPARMQGRAADDLKRLISEGLKDAGLGFANARTFVTPRRLAFVADGIPERTPDVSEERRGPRADAPERAIQGFKGSLPKGAAIEERETPKGTFLFAQVEQKGAPTVEVLATMLGELLSKFPWPKSMRWGIGQLKWVRPLHRASFLFDGEVTLLHAFGTAASAEEADRTTFLTYGHRFLSPGAIEVAGFADYEAKLRAAKVLIDPAERKRAIAEAAAKLANAESLTLRDDPGLLDEVAGLVEWPVALMGGIDDAYMDLPPEVLVTTMRANQKYFVCENADGKLANRFVVIANTETADGGAGIVAGNERVLRARLADARFFWDTDRESSLEERWPGLKNLTFHAELGSMYQKGYRAGYVAFALSGQLRDQGIELDIMLAEEATRFSKCDLVSSLVIEFPELQGIVGGYLASNDDLDPQIAEAIRQQYLPSGPSDAVPTAPVSICNAILDKIDTLVGFFILGEKPTGSKDPFALRRAAIGVFRIIIENNLRIRLEELFKSSVRSYILLEDEDEILKTAKSYATDIESGQLIVNRSPISRFAIEPPFESGVTYYGEDQQELFSILMGRLRQLYMHVLEHSEIQDRDVDAIEFFASIRTRRQPASSVEDKVAQIEEAVAADLLAFFAERLKVYLRERGVRYDLIDAVFATGGEDDLVRLLARVGALEAFLATDDGTNLLAAYKRAANILKIEEKKDGRAYAGDIDAGRIAEDAERALADGLAAAVSEIESALDAEDFARAMGDLARLRPLVDRFFDDVTVNADDAALRDNRLNILAAIRHALAPIADFSRIEG